MDELARHASESYAIVYFGIVLVVALLECVVPRRPAGDTLALRWFGNFGLTILDGLLVRVLFPVVGIAWAIYCYERGWGLFNRVAWPVPVGIVISFLALDLLTYVQHYLLHRLPVLWRLHRTHHTDHEYDFTTGIRFHPLEAALSNALSVTAIFALGAPPLAVVAAQFAAMAFSFLEHANVRTPRTLDRFVRTVFVTPDMHRIHHSQASGETRSNYSNIFSFWDRLFGTYVEAPAAGHDGIEFGLPEFPGRKHQTLHWMLVQPFLPEPPLDAQVASAVVDMQDIPSRPA